MCFRPRRRTERRAVPQVRRCEGPRHRHRPAERYQPDPHVIWEDRHAHVVLQRVEKGKLDLDAPLSTYIDNFPKEILNSFDSDGEPILVAAGRVATLREALLHINGSTYDVFNAHHQRFPVVPPKKDTTTLGSEAVRIPWFLSYVLGLTDHSHWMQSRMNAPLAFEPGTGWEYVQGFDYAALAIEAVTGLKLGEYFQKNIYSPLGLKTLTFYPPPSTTSALVRPHTGGHLRRAPSSGGRAQDRLGRNWSGRGLLALLGNGTHPNGTRLLAPELVEKLIQPGLLPELLGFLEGAHGVHRTDLALPWSLPEVKKQWSLGGLFYPEGLAGQRSARSIPGSAWQARSGWSTGRTAWCSWPGLGL